MHSTMRTIDGGVGQASWVLASLSPGPRLVLEARMSGFEWGRDKAVELMNAALLEQDGPKQADILSQLRELLINKHPELLSEFAPKLLELQMYPVCVNHALGLRFGVLVSSQACFPDVDGFAL